MIKKTLKITYLFFYLSIFFFIFIVINNTDFLEKYSPIIEFLKNQKKDHSFLIFICFFSLFSLISFFGFCLPIVFLSGFIFGAVHGAFISYISLIFGSYVFYVLNFELFKSEKIKKYIPLYQNLNKLVNKNEFMAVFLLRFFGFGMPFLFHNLLPLLFGVKKKFFILATSLGIIPLSLQSFFGKSIYDAIVFKGKIDKDIFFDFHFYFPLLIILFTLLSSLIIKKIFFDRKN